MGSLRGPGVIEPAGIGPYRKRLMKWMGLGSSGRIMGLSIFGGSEGALVFRFSIFLRGGDGGHGEGVWDRTYPEWIEFNIRTHWDTYWAPMGPMGPISDFSDFWPLGSSRNFLESFPGAALRAGCAYRTKETSPSNGCLFGGY